MLAKKNEILYQEKVINCRPLLKWAGGKTQLLTEITPKIPKKYGRYIEPFFGGGALFFALKPSNGIIADSNPELVNLYQSVADDVEAAARTIFLNRTCFNGLYRVNKKGQFNVPFGKYKNPKIIDEEALRAASIILKDTTIICGDYKDVLRKQAQPGDFIFLDPPYLPISEYADFQRYTKEQFYEEDHTELAAEVQRLHELGCHIILTNSNHPLVHEQYRKFPIEVVQTKRYISCNGKRRTGEDVIVTIPPKPRFDIRIVPESLSEQIKLYPPTRYMGSKNKLLSEIWGVASQFEFDTAVDLFSGSGIVGYMFKSYGKTVISNDYMTMASVFAKAMIENNNIVLTSEETLSLLESKGPNDSFVET
ncbi:Dam family site-specific DNA-(adenine-N6)-methyltransferase, partial [Acinetobacter baumannii]|uniref:Dam family site-specific DNA-(adenine-N6)-methyltransferase n=1 Tax=Acinetobacter baumannii TaxID=470 RepID=UPI000DEFDFCA